MLKRVHFNSSALPFLLVAPQILITILFFIWPAGQAVYQSFLVEDAFGLSTEFVWFDNFAELIDDKYYLQSFQKTFVFSLLVTLVSMGFSLMLAAMADRVIKGGDCLSYPADLALCRGTRHCRGTLGVHF